MEILFPLLFGTISGLLIILSVFFTIRNSLRLHSWVRVPGTVVRFEETVTGTGKAVKTKHLEASLGGEVVSYPVIEYKTKEGDTHTFTSRIGSSDSSTRDQIRPGTQLRVLYNPAEPTHAITINPGLFWAFPAILGALGLMFAAAVISMLS
ncbi:MAG: DUF3592 domain-containing protein [Patescibacteria group bacterium]